MPDRFGNPTTEELRNMYMSQTNYGQNLGALTDKDIEMFYNAGAGVMPEEDYRNWFANSMRNEFGGAMSDRDAAVLNQLTRGGILGATSDMDMNRLGNAIVSGGTNMNPNSLGILGGMYGNNPAMRGTTGNLSDQDYMRFMQNMSGILR